MRNQILAFSMASLFFCAVVWGGQGLRSTVKVPVAGVSGHITIDEVVGKNMQSNPIPKLKLYLLRVDDSRQLAELQDGCRRATADPHTDSMSAYRTCDQNLRKAVDVVPTLPSVATTETDRDGLYEFAEVPAAGHYRIVAVKTVEGAEPFVIVGMITRMKPGERVTLNLSANDPWTRAATP